jgi:hypothetical protein
MKEKLENFYSRYIESIAVKRKRNAEWAKSSVRDSASTTSEKALQLKVIDFIAKDREDLLKQLDGREVNNKKLKTASATVVEIPMSMREKVFQAIAHPQMMLVLMLTLIVTYEITGELTRHFPYETCPATIAGHSVSLTGIVSSLTVLSSRFSTPRPACGLRVKWFLPSSCVPRRFSTERRQNVASSTSPRDCRPAGLSPAVVWATSATQSLPKMARNAPSKDEV